MSFRNSFALTTGFCALLTTLLLGCDVKMGESAPAAEVREFKTAECLSNTVPSIQSFFKGQASDADVTNTWDCVGSAIGQFRHYVRSKNGNDRYTPQEMATYLENNFLKNDGRKISPALQAEVMKVKRVFVGGELDILTTTDLQNLTDFVIRMRKMTLAMNPYMKIFSQNWQPLLPLNSRVNLDFFESANTHVQSFAQELNAPGLESYQIPDALNLIHELGVFITDADQRERLEKDVALYIPLAQKLKKALAGGDQASIQKSEWRNMLFGASRSYVQYLRYEYFLKSSPETTNEVRLNFITRLVEDTVSALGDVVSQKPSQQIAQGELNEVLVEAAKVWPSFKVSDQLVPQGMKLKQVLFGGDLNAISLADLQRAQPKLGLVQSLALQILPYYKVYSGDWKPDANDAPGSEQYFSAAQTQLVSALASFGQVFETDFDLNSVPDIVHEIMNSYPSLVSDPSQLEKTVRLYLPVVVQVKNLAFAQSDSVVRKADWSKFLSLLGSAYGDYQYYDLFYQGGSLRDPKNLSVIESLGQQALKTVQQVLSGRNSQQVSKSELTNFLLSLSQAWPSLKISSVLIDEGMKLKALLLGGTETSLSAADIQRAKAKLPSIKAIVLKISPYYEVYAQTWDHQSTSNEKAEAFVAEARLALAESLQDASALIEGSYDLTHLTPLVHEVFALYPDWIEDAASVEKMVADYSPLVVDLKNMIFAENDSLMKKVQWGTFLSLVGDAYTSYLYEVYFVKGHGYESARALSYIEKVGDQFLGFGANVLKAKKTHVLTSIEIKRLIDRIVPLDILPESLDARTLRGLVTVVVNRLLVDPDQRIIGNLPQVINQHSLNVGQLEFKNWIHLEALTASFFPSGDETYSASKTKKMYADHYKVKGLTDFANAGLKEMIMALDTSVPLALDDKERLIIEDHDRPYDRKSLAQVNLDRMIVRLFSRSYITELSRLRNYAGITLAEAQTAFAELKPAAVKLGVIDADNTTFPSSRFREANMFVARANGDNLVSFQEGVDLVAMIWSGLNINTMFKADILKNCVGHINNRGNTFVDKSCLTQVYLRRMPTYMSSMPYFAGFIKGITDDERAVYFENVLKSAGYVPRDDNLVKMSDVALLPHVVQYIEMNFTKFDHDRNWVIDVQEALEAFPCFRNIIKEVAKGQVGDDELDDLFTYILRYGKPPETVQEKLSYALNWRNKPDRWVVNADRITLAKILGYIADQVNTPAAPSGQ